jgi:LCP family protein required for cell wall assembly
VDPDRDAIALLSIPRDLQVNIPGVGLDKFNAAYSAGGPELTLDVVKQLTGLEINHVVNINFTGFAEAVNAIECVYIDVDRRYFIPEESNYSAIDIEAGYQRLCGFKALQYVRYRYDDNDLVRSARQQDFLREARQKLPLDALIEDRDELLDIFTEYTTSDISEAVPLLELLKTLVGAQDAPISEVHFPANLGDGTSGYVTASEEAIKNAVQQFLGVEGTPGARPAGEPDRPPEDEGEEEPKEEKAEQEQEPEGPPMIDAAAAGQQYAQAIEGAETKGGEPMVKFPIFHPTRLVPGSTMNDASRAFVIDGPEKDKYYGYKMVVSVPGPSGFSEYYGVSGTNWEGVPILENPSETREIDGRDYSLFYDGDRLRLIGWKTKHGAYWVNNSLLQSLEAGEMISIATSMRELGG